MFWVIAAVVVVLGTVLAWWSSGRAKMDRRRHSVERSRHMNHGDVDSFRVPPQHRPNGPGPSGPF